MRIDAFIYEIVKTKGGLRHEKGEHCPPNL